MMGNYLIEEETAFVTAAFRLQNVFDASHEFSWDNREYRRHIQAIIAQEKPDFTSLVDVGCGGGKLLDLIGQEYPGRRIYGIDPVYRGQRVVAGNVYGSLARTEPVDVILLKEVLQHVTSVPYALARLTRMLNREGVIIIIDRNPVSFLGLRKSLYERLGLWMYPQDSPFRERWYYSWQWRQMLERIGRVVYFHGHNSRSGRSLFLARDNRYFVIALRPF